MVPYEPNENSLNVNSTSPYHLNIQVKCQSIITNDFQKREATRGRFRNPSYIEDEILC